MPVINKSPDESKCVTIPKGLITCMRSINEQCVRQLTMVWKALIIVCLLRQTSTKQVPLMDSGYHLRMQSQNILQVCYFWKQIRYSTSVMMEFTRQAAQTITSFDVTDK